MHSIQCRRLPTPRFLLLAGVASLQLNQISSFSLPRCIPHNIQSLCSTMPEAFQQTDDNDDDGFDVWFRSRYQAENEIHLLDNKLCEGPQVRIFNSMLDKMST